MTIGAGSRDERVGELGVAHLLEHTLFKGTEKRKAWQVNCRLENRGGEINAFTTKEETVVHATVMRRDFGKAVELIDDIIFHSTFPFAEIEKEKEVIYDEINMYKDSPEERIYDDFEDLLFAGSELGHNILGRKQTISKLQNYHIQSFVERNYTTDRMVFAVIGNISPKIFVAVVERYLGGEKATSREVERSVPEVVGRFDVTKSHPSHHQVRCVMGARAYSLNDKRRLALILMTNILGGPSATSRLNVALRERNALTYCVEALYTPLSDSGMLTIYFSCEKEKLEQCRSVIANEIERMMNEPMTARGLAVAKRQLIGQFAISAENNEAYMLGVGKSYLVFGVVDSTEEVYRKVEEIRPEDIMAVARDVLPSLSMLTYI
ncbi:MAG: insulinase family protein [Tidjanibacter sp.]|nr:insulinase family protein [Tidjanibacter sp.]